MERGRYMAHSAECRNIIESGLDGRGNDMRMRYAKRSTKREQDTTGRAKSEKAHRERQEAERERIRHIAEEMSDETTFAEVLRRGQRRAREVEEPHVYVDDIFEAKAPAIANKRSGPLVMCTSWLQVKAKLKRLFAADDCLSYILHGV